MITTQPMDQTVDIGGNVTFTCETFGGTNPITFRWLFDGAELIADPGHIAVASDFNTATLMITNVIATDGGAYSCEATDAGVGNVTSNEATLFSKCLFIHSMCLYISLLLEREEKSAL